jgi:hypothetical protein
MGSGATGVEESSAPAVRAEVVYRSRILKVMLGLEVALSASLWVGIVAAEPWLGIFEVIFFSVIAWGVLFYATFWLWRPRLEVYRAGLVIMNPRQIRVLIWPDILDVRASPQHLLIQTKQTGWVRPVGVSQSRTGHGHGGQSLNTIRSDLLERVRESGSATRSPAPLEAAALREKQSRRSLRFRLGLLALAMAIVVLVVGVAA